ncbi:MAG: iron-containing alcohol dehydrogenase [Planctomycetaceae bacterium]|jgi:alcohol dehydrogenase class IV|nr:iron-containing alcohol dehydrogenase [Planctomycetaceae bacterium]
MIYDLLLPLKIIFGAGRRSDVGVFVRPIASRAIVISGSRKLSDNGKLSEIICLMESSGVSVIAMESISHEPTTTDVDNFTFRFISENSVTDKFDDLIVIGIGGGAAIDLAKSVAAMIPQQINKQNSIRNYLEGVGDGSKLIAKPLPVAAIPTTAGTGAEATKNAVISSSEADVNVGLGLFKKSLRDEGMLPRLAIIDPELAASCPNKITVESGMDAVTQLFESYVAKRRQPFTDALIEQGLVQAFEALPKLIEYPGDIDLRGKMAHAALLSGISLTNAGLGMAHGIAPALGVYCGVSHGAACALLLPVTLRTNADVCKDRYGRLGKLILGIDQNTPNEIATNMLIEHVESICNKLNTPRKLADLNIEKKMIPIIAKNSKGSSMDGNPKKLSEQEIAEILTSIQN